MTNAFDILALPARLSLDEGTLQQAYLSRSRQAHPDHGGSDREASEVNAAYEVLKAPDKRVKHLMEVAAPEAARSWRTVPLDERMMSLFSSIGQTLDASAKIVERKSRAQSALAKALLANEEMQQRERLEELGSSIASRLEEMETVLPELDTRLESDPASLETWKEIASLQARMAYLTKWQAQIRERLLQLMM
ncbi:DnaJ domain-containing protein [Verrucomicrobium sp. BvORR106]|uniref:DnaJ domain-containing protein n=1 Tax=Verrucomicrobium sp. BvORR106 TaxID=1403819 RepID=UPI00056E8AC9|nr:DnaJ domain-containing protein [Verrucomicrobium sp. BvORR106]